jgi:alanine racemase
VDSLKTVAEIDLNALSHNLEIVKKKTKNRAILAVVKADAYGHGLIDVAKHLLKSGASMLGVAFVEEAVTLRESRIRAPILVFFDPHSIDHFFKHNLTPVIYDFKSAKAFSDKAYKYNRKIAVHIKVDTGMGRVGLRFESALSEILKIAEMKNLQLEGVMSHLSDADLKDKDFTAVQHKRFVELIKALKKKKLHFKYSHIANSAATLRFPQLYLDMVRPGIMLYGYGPERKKYLKPVLSLKSKIIFIKKVPPGTPISYGRTFITKRKSTIATIPIGYADGYNRKLSNNGEVLINGTLAPVVGRVCMDTIMVDVTNISRAQENTEVVLIGKQGIEKITAQDIADRVGTIPYEVLTSIGQRVKRIYRRF